MLRFDFYGCGDSQGEDHEGSVSQRLTDIGVAVGEIGTRCEPSKLCLVGLRFGATLAMIYGAQNGGMEGMVLWDPIAKGNTYIGELGSAYPELLRSPVTAREDDGMAEHNGGALGLPRAQTLFRDLREINLLTTAQAPARSVLLIDSEHDNRPENLREHLGSLTSKLDYEHLTGVDFRTAESDKVLFANEVVQMAVSWISTKCP